MSKKLKTLIVGVVSLLLVALFGCSAMMDRATPCYMDQDAAVYADEEVKTIFGFTSLWEAVRVGKKMDFVHDFNQTEWERLQENDVKKHNFLQESQNGYIASAKDFQQVVLTPNGPIGMLLPTLFGGTLGALLIPRPGDKKKTV